MHSTTTIYKENEEGFMARASEASSALHMKQSSPTAASARFLYVTVSHVEVVHVKKGVAGT
jgi:hypothetical protein